MQPVKWPIRIMCCMQYEEIFFHLKYNILLYYSTILCASMAVSHVLGFELNAEFSCCWCLYAEHLWICLSLRLTNSIVMTKLEYSCKSFRSVSWGGAQHLTHFIFATQTIIQFNVDSCQLDLKLQIIRELENPINQPSQLKMHFAKINRFQFDFSVSFIIWIFIYYQFVYGRNRKKETNSIALHPHFIVVRHSK